MMNMFLFLQDLLIMLLTFPDTMQNVVLHTDINGLDWFHAGAVCDILGFSNPAQTIANHCPYASKLLDYQEGRGRAALFVSEYGLYELIMISRKEISAKFRRWIAYEVLPTIRKTGSYTATTSDQQHFTPFGITIQQKIQECDRALETAPVGTGKIKALLADKAALQTQLKLQQSQATNLKEDALGSKYWTLLLFHASVHFDRRRFSAAQFLDWALNAKCEDEDWDDAIAWLRKLAGQANSMDRVSVRKFGRWLATHQNTLDGKLYLAKVGTCNRIGLYKVVSVSHTLKVC